MDLTLRQLQRALHKSRSNPDVLVLKGVYELVQINNVLARGQRSTSAALKNGHIWSLRSPYGGGQAGYTVYDLHHQVDSWTKQYGPNTPVHEVIKKLEAAQPQAGGGDQSDGEPQDGDQQDGEPRPGQPGQQSTTSEQAAVQAAANWEYDEQRRQMAEMQEARRQELRAKEAAEKAKQAAQALADAKKALKNARRQARAKKALATQKAKRELRNARRKASFNREAQESAPSLASRRAIARANGRLRAVPVALRNRMAEIINRLVGNTGSAGGNVSPIPSYDCRKLVKRMLVKRPLPNALKEDVITGRPVTLFLPDISPSCSAQAQVACDMANAAGYAGVSGSDVLVLPHSNGCIEGSADDYIPWFNGKPVDVRGEELEKLFTSIVTGTSKYRIRVAVAIGDHDAEDMYRQLAVVRSLLQFVWLHNGGDDKPRLEPHNEYSVGDQWSSEALKKVKLVWGCHRQSHMLSGLDAVLK